MREPLITVALNMQALEPAAMDSETVCLLPMPEETLAPALPDTSFSELLEVASLVTGFAQR
ncbi:hypothetical protein ACVBEG_27700 [Pseudomonas sp. GG8]